MDTRKRLQFEFTPEALDEIDQLQRLTGLTSRAELIRHALRFLQWAVEETYNKKASLLIEKDGKAREVVFPFWKRSEEAIFAGNSNGHGKA
jgi:metal-responsive CopG/Arc/MetJ family transcriptional regulator